MRKHILFCILLVLSSIVSFGMKAEDGQYIKIGFVIYNESDLSNDVEEIIRGQLKEEIRNYGNFLYIDNNFVSNISKPDEKVANDVNSTRVDYLVKIRIYKEKDNYGVFCNIIGENNSFDFKHELDITKFEDSIHQVTNIIVSKILKLGSVLLFTNTKYTEIEIEGVKQYKSFMERSDIPLLMSDLPAGNYKLVAQRRKLDIILPELKRESSKYGFSPFINYFKLSADEIKDIKINIYKNVELQNLESSLNQELKKLKKEVQGRTTIALLSGLVGLAGLGLVFDNKEGIEEGIVLSLVGLGTLFIVRNGLQQKKERINLIEKQIELFASFNRRRIDLCFAYRF